MLAHTNFWNSILISEFVLCRNWRTSGRTASLGIRRELQVLVKSTSQEEVIFVSDQEYLFNQKRSNPIPQWPFSVRHKPP